MIKALEKKCQYNRFLIKDKYFELFLEIMTNFVVVVVVASV